MSSREARLRSVARYLKAAPQVPDAADDVRLIAAMNIRDPRVVEQLLLTDRKTTMAQLPEVLAALGAGTSEPATAGASTDDVQRRRDALKEWGASAGAYLPDADITRIAESGALSPEELSALPTRAKALVRHRSEEIAEVLKAAVQPSSARTAPQVPSQAAPHSRTAVDAENLVTAGGATRGSRGGRQSASSVAASPGSTAPAPPVERTAPGPDTAAHDTVDDPRADLTDDLEDELSDQHESTHLSGDFAVFDFSRPCDYREAAAASVRWHDDQIQLSWQPAVADEAAGWFAYRVTSSDSDAPVDTDSGDTVAVTRQATVSDDGELRSLVRHYAVWVYTGADEHEARVGQPRLHAVGRLIRPVTDMVVRAERGRVTGQWRAAEGEFDIRVLRIPAGRAQHVTGYDPTYAFGDTLQIKQGGFVDVPPPGEYEYRVFTQVMLGHGAEFSDPVRQRVQVLQDVAMIEDLTAEVVEDGTITVRWSHPAQGTVELYRLQRPASPTLIGQTLRRDQIRQSLDDAEALVHPHDLVDGRAVSVGVEIPDGWVTVHLLPITRVSEDRLRVGRPTTVIQPARPNDVICLERVTQQVLTFAWPGDQVIAGQPDQMVMVFQLPPDAEVTTEPSTDPIAQVTRDEYNAQGGVFLERPLPPGGCLLQVHSAIYSGGRRRLSAPAVVRYPGLTKLHYRVSRPEPVVAPTPQRSRWSWGRKAAEPVVPQGPKQITVQADRELRDVVLVLVHNPTRVPLYSGDGEQIARDQHTLRAGEWLQLPLPQRDLPGFVRMFVIGEPGGRPVAVLEASIADLRVQ